MIASAQTLEKLSFGRVQEALAKRTQTSFGTVAASRLQPGMGPQEVEASLERIQEILTGGDLSLGGVEEITPLLERLRAGELAQGTELLEIAYTLDTAAQVKRGILASERPELSKLAQQMSSFDGVLRTVREQLAPDGSVRDDATPKLREIRRRLNPLRGRIRERMQALLERYSEFIQDPIVTLRRDRFVIPVKASSQSRVPGIALDTSDSGATVFVEPQSVVPLNNELALLEFEERDEVRRILIALGQRLSTAPGIDETLELLGHLDLAQAAAALARDWGLARPQFTAEKRVRLQGAFHPLVEGCVPNDISLDGEKRLLIITGPNAGGKTVLLKTLGLAALMGSAGLFVAASAKSAPLLPRFSQLLVDIGDEQSIEASLSTYAGHLVNLKRIAEESTGDVLVLIDELGSGTDPDEGAALSQAILEQVLRSGALGLVTTHLAPLKVFASEVAGVENAAMKFDVDQLKPTYRLEVGQPGRSYALAIARRMGLGEELLGRASELLGPESERLESLLEQLEKGRDELREELGQAQADRERALEEARLLREQIDRLRESEAQLLAQAAERADEMLQDTLEQATRLRRRATSDPEARSSALEELQQLRRGARKQAQAARPARPTAQLKPGATVHVESYQAQGPILEMRGDQVLVQLGLLKVEVPRRDVRLVKGENEADRKGRTLEPIGSSGFDDELNLRGARVEEGLESLRDFIYEAHALKVERVRILHGKGTGALRDAVRNYLRDERLVERYEDAVPYEGGHGVTVAYLRL